MRLFTKAMLVGLLGVSLVASSLLLAGGGPNVTGAKLYIKQNNMEQAMKVLMKEVEKVDPKNEDAWYLLGYIYARQNKYDKMVEAFNKAVELKPKFREKGLDVNGDPGTLFLAEDGVDRIKRVVWGNAFNNAVKYFNNGVNATTDSTRVSSFEQAVEAFRLAAEIMPDSSLAYRNMAASYMNLGEYEKSIEPLKEALEHNPNDVEVKKMLGQVYMASGQDSLAMPLLEELWDSGVRDPQVADFLSRGYLKAEKTDKAKEVYKEALKMSPDNFEFRYNYGTVLLEAGEFDNAIEQLNMAHEIDPENPDINYNLGAAYLNRGVARRDSLPENSDDTSFREDFEKAFPYLEKAVAINPDDTRVWFTLGRIAGQLNKVALSGYAFAKGENERSALDKKVVVGMDTTTLKLIVGEPDAIKHVESDRFPNVAEWVYKKREKGAKSKIALTEPINVYVKNDKVDGILTVK